MTTHPAQDAENKKALEALHVLGQFVQLELSDSDLLPEYQGYIDAIEDALTTPVPQSEKMEGNKRLIRILARIRGIAKRWPFKEIFNLSTEALSILTKESPNNEQ